MSTFLRDIQYGYRTLLRNPGFTTVAVLSLALGIGANTAIFSFLDTVLLRDLPVRDADSLVLFGEGKTSGMSGGPREGSDLFGWQEFRDIRQHNVSFDDIAAVNSNLTGVYFNVAGVPEGALAQLVSGNYFDLVGVTPAAGRLLNARTDDAIAASPFVVLNHAFWMSRFRGENSAIGQALRIGERTFTIVGVAQRGFFGTRLGESPDFWIPLSMMDQMPGMERPLLQDPQVRYASLIGRLRKGVPIAQAHVAGVVLQPGGKGFTGLGARYETPLRILMVVVGLVLLIACANVASLSLVVGAKRQKEFALRIALGAKRSRLIRQLLTESLMMAGCAGLLGVLIASAGGKLLLNLISTGSRAVPVAFALDARVLAFTVAVSLTTGVLFGLLPALRSSRVDINSTLKKNKTNVIGRFLVAAQVALSLGLLVTAGLLLHSLANLAASGTGFDKDNVLLIKLDGENSGHKSDEALIPVYRRIEESIARLPGVVSAGMSSFTFNEGMRTHTFTAPGVNLPRESRLAIENFITPGYFAALRIPIFLGRALEQRDSVSSEMVTVVSESFARKVFGDAGLALGKQITFRGEDKPVRIVGIAGDTKVQNVRDKELKLAFRPVYQIPHYMDNVAVRVAGDPLGMASTIRRSIQEADRGMPVGRITTLADSVGDSLVRERVIAQLSAFFAFVALLLSAIGLYGTISFAVARRTNEIGIRMALGAERTGVLGLVMKDAMTLTGLGIAVGLPLALVMTRQLDSMLYGLEKVDALSVIGSVAALTIVAALAGYLPARRAAAVDPMVALRYE